MLPQFPRSVQITWNSRRACAPAVNMTVWMNKRLFSGVGSSWITSGIAALHVETGEVTKVIAIFRPFSPHRAQEQNNGGKKCGK